MITVPGFIWKEIFYEDEYIAVGYASEISSSRQVSLKVVKSGSRTLIENSKLMHEFKVLAKLPIDGVFRPYAHHMDGHSSVLAYDPINAITLRDYAAKERLSAADLLRLSVRITERLGELHDRRMVHLNIRPDTILIQRDTEKVYLTGFGYALSIQEIEEQGLHLSLLEGHPAYMSPELTGRLNSRVDTRTDLYSLGVTLYEQVWGKLPFLADDALEWSHAHVAAEPFPPDPSGQNMPSEMTEIIMSLLSKDPEQRCRNAEQLKERLEQCLNSSKASLSPAYRFKKQTRPEQEALGRKDMGPAERRYWPEQSTGYPQVLDLAAIMKSSQLFADATGGEAIVQKLLHLLMQCAGAGSASLILFSEGGRRMELSLTADGAGSISGRKDTLSLAAAGTNEIREDIIKKVRRWGQPISEADTSNGSVLGLPVFSKGEVAGCLYLTNRLSANGFAADRYKVLKLLASKALFVMSPLRASGLLSSANSRGAEKSGKRESLTPREREVLYLMAAGSSNKEIAGQLTITAETVKSHVRNIFSKLKVDRRMKAVAVAKTLNLLEEGRGKLQD